MRSKKAILSSVLSIVLCLSLIAGSTFALFTSEDKTNIAVNAGDVDVVANITLEKVYSPTEIDSVTGYPTKADNAASGDTFMLGGKVTATAGKITLDNIAPGDKAWFKVTMTNNSTVDLIQRMLVNCVSSDKTLYNELIVGVSDTDAIDGSYTYYTDFVSEWKTNDAIYGTGTEAVRYISIELPGYVGNKAEKQTCELAVNVMAVQGNASYSNVANPIVYPVNDQGELDDAIAAATDVDTIYIAKPIDTLSIAFTGAKVINLRGYVVNDLTINAADGTFHIYNTVNTLNVVAAAHHSVHVYDYVDNAVLNEGRLVITEGAVVNNIISAPVAGDNVTVDIDTAASVANTITVNGAAGSTTQINVHEDAKAPAINDAANAGTLSVVEFSSIPVGVEELKAALAAAKDGDTIVLGGNVVLTDVNGVSGTLTPMFTIDKSITLDLNGMTISIADDVKAGSITGMPALLYVTGENTNVTVKNGTVDAEAGSNGAYAIAVDGGATLNIESGFYTGGPTAIEVKQGNLNILGGNFALTASCEATIPSYSKYLINCVDANYANDTANVTVYGGTFKNFDPANNASEGAGTNYVANYYVSTENGGYYTVAPAANLVQIHNVDDLLAFADNLSNNKVDYTDKIVVLTADISLAGYTWFPIDSWNGGADNLLIDGQGHTISNMKVDGGSYAAFIGDNRHDMTIQNLTFDKASVTTSGSFAGVVMGRQYNKVVLNNVNVTNSSVRSTADKGIRVGGLIGFSVLHENAKLTISNCTVENTTVTAYHNVGGLVGTLMSYQTYVDNWTLTNNKVTGSTIHVTAPAAVNVAYGSAFAAEGGGWKHDFDTSAEYFLTNGNNTQENNTFLCGGLIYENVNEFHISTPEQLVALSNNVNAKISYEGKKIVLDNDIDMAGVAYKPAGSADKYPSTTFAGDFDGQYHTIFNLTTSSFESHDKSAAGLFGSITGTVKNLKMDKATVTSYHYAGAIAGFSSANVGMAIENCHVTNSTIISVPQPWGDGYDNGDKAGGIIGYMVTGDVVNNCSVTNTTIGGYRDIGGIVGHGAGTISNCSVVDIELKANKEHNYKNYTTDEEFHINNIVGENAGATLDNNKVNGVVETVIVPVGTAQELLGYLESGSEAGSGNTIILIQKDIDCSGFAWTPHVIDGYNGAGIITIEGQNHTITNLSAPLLSGGFAGNSGIVIKDLTIADSNIVSKNDQGSGAFIECIDSMKTIELNNCHLISSTVNGSRTGGLIGWTSGWDKAGEQKMVVNVINCSVVDCKITGEGTVGGIMGHAGANRYTWNNIIDCTVKNTELVSNDDSYRVGTIIGTANSGHTVISGCTSEGNTTKQLDTTEGKVGQEIARPDNQSELYGRTVLNGTGSLTIDNVAIGGTYTSPEAAA